MHTGLNQLRGDLVQLVVGNTHIVCRDTIGCLGWETTLEIELDGGHVVTFAFFDFSGLSFLVGLEEPLEIVVFKFADVLMLEFLGDLD